MASLLDVFRRGRFVHAYDVVRTVRNKPARSASRRRDAHPLTHRNLTQREMEDTALHGVDIMWRGASRVSAKVQVIHEDRIQVEARRVTRGRGVCMVSFETLSMNHHGYRRRGIELGQFRIWRWNEA